MTSPQMKKRLEEIARARISDEDGEGGSFIGNLKKVAKQVHHQVKKHHVISRLAVHLGHPEISAAAHALGYGLVPLEGGSRGKEGVVHSAKFYSDGKHNHFVTPDAPRRKLTDYQQFVKDNYAETREMILMNNPNIAPKDLNIRTLKRVALIWKTGKYDYEGAGY